MDTLEYLKKKDGLPQLKFQKDKVCEACQMGKQHQSLFKSKKQVSTTKPLELIHMDLVKPIRVASLGGRHYAFVIVDDYSRLTWVFFLTTKDETFDAFKTFAKRISNKKGYEITCMRSDHGREFEN